MTLENIVAAAVAIVGAAMNGTWALSLESKSRALDERLDGVEKLGDERQTNLWERLNRIEDKLDRLPNNMMDLITGRKDRT